MRPVSLLLIISSMTLLGACATEDTSEDPETTTSADSIPPPTSDDQSTSTTTPESSTTSTTEQVRSAPATLELIVPGPVVEAAEGSKYANPGAVVHADGTLHMFRNSFSSWPGPSQTHHMISDDGVTWQEQGLVLDSEMVPYTDSNAFIMEVLIIDGEWVAYFYTYEGRGRPGHIGRATAPDPGGPWSVDPQPILSPGPEGDWDSVRVVEPTVIEIEDGYLMYYAGIDGSETSAIGLAMSSDGIDWVKHDDPTTGEAPFSASDPVITGTGDWDRGSIGNPDVETSHEGYVLVFDVFARFQAYGLATSSDGVNWNAAPEPFLTREIAPDGQRFWQSELIRIGSGHQFYLEVGPGAGPTRVYAFDMSLSAGSSRSISVDAEVDGEEVTVTVEAHDFNLGFIPGDSTGDSGHLHLYVNRPPPRNGDPIPIGVEGILHSPDDEVSVALPPGDHVLWVVIGDGDDRVLVPPDPVRVTVSVDPDA